jgi:thioester reductase-like protein
MRSPVRARAIGGAVPSGNTVQAVEQRLAELWREVLDVPTAHLEESFFAAGGDSLSALALTEAIHDGLWADLPLEAVFVAPSGHALAEQIAQGTSPRRRFARRTATVDELRRDAVLDAALVVPADLATDGPFVVTGGGTFLGAHVISELIARTDREVIVLDTAPAACERLLVEHGLSTRGPGARLTVHEARLGQPRLGLSDDTYQELASTAGAIFHLAEVRPGYEGSYLPYDALRAPNVLGTRHVLELACTQRATPVHLVSRLSVGIRAGDRGRVVVFEDVDRGPEGFVDGYNQSRWVAEQLATAARDRGLPVWVYRLGDIIGSTVTGRSDLTDPLMRTVLACIATGYAYENSDPAHVTPVDYIADAVVSVALQSQAATGTLHLVAGSTPLRWSDFAAVVSGLGHAVKPVSWLRWGRALKRYHREHGDVLHKGTVGLMPDIRTSIRYVRERGREIVFDDANARAVLKAAGVAGRPIDAPTIERWIEVAAGDPRPAGGVPG